MGYSKEQFIDKIAQQFICSICQDVVKEPFQCSQCENLFCCECINQWLSTQKQKQCPNCRKLNPDLQSPVKLVLGILNDYKLRCQFCQSIVTLERFQLHQQNECSQKNQLENCLSKIQQLEAENKVLKQDFQKQKDQHDQLLETYKKLEQKYLELEGKSQEFNKKQEEFNGKEISSSSQSQKPTTISKSMSFISNQSKQFNFTTKIYQSIE